MTNNTKPCANCGYHLDETEQSGMSEFKGLMYSEELNENLREILEQAHMAGQADAGVDPSYSRAKLYSKKETT
jgi:hypothetical protein